MSSKHNTPTMKDAPRDEDQQQQQQAAYKKKCDQYVQSGLSRNVTIQFLLQKLVEMGCEPPKGFIRCMDCGEKQAGGGFGMIEETILPKNKQKSSSTATTTTTDNNNDKKTQQDHQRRSATPQCQRSIQDLKDQLRGQQEGTLALKLTPEIFLCQQHLRNETHAHESMVHELIHAVDFCRAKMDPLHNCLHMACTEIRAENLSGECGFWRDVGRIDTFSKHGQVCVKRRAALSLQANPNCRERADEYVEAAFDRCYQDTFPFDRHPNLR